MQTWRGARHRHVGSMRWKTSAVMDPSSPIRNEYGRERLNTNRKVAYPVGLIAPVLIQTSGALLAYAAFREFRHPTLEVWGAQYIYFFLSGACLWIGYRAYSNVPAVSNDEQITKVNVSHHQRRILQRLARLQMTMFGLMFVGGGLIVGLQEWHSSNWPEVTAVVVSNEARPGGTRVVFDLEYNGQSVRSEARVVRGNLWLSEYQPGTTHVVRCNPGDPTQALTEWNNWASTRARHIIVIAILVGLLCIRTGSDTGWPTSA